MNPIGIVFRRIIYAIPLKLLLVLLAVFGILFACFSSAENVSDLITYLDSGTFSINGQTTKTFYTLSDSQLNKNICVKFYDWAGGSNSKSIKYWYFSQSNSTFGNYSVYIWQSSNDQIVCMNMNLKYIRIYNNDSSTQSFKYNIFIVDDLLATALPKLTSLECQTEYNLIPISSVDQNYCTTNNLCPTYDCPINPIGTGTLTNLYINNILHIGAPNIVMNIPEEIDWDYAYTQGGTTMNIDIVGYNQDFEKIEGWIDTNNYKPSSEDFTNIFTSGFSNFGGLLIATLFVILVFYFVKKMFK